MSQIVLSDEALKRAAASVRQSFLDSLPPPSQCEHEFSDAFQVKMKRLIFQDKLRRGLRKTMRRAAMFFLAALLGVSAWLTVDAEARAAFFSWVREVYEEHIVYRFFGEPAEEELPAYRITWLPEGYEEVDVYDSDDLFNAFYQRGDNVLSGFGFEYLYIQDSSALGLLIDETEYRHKTVEINGMQADYYQAMDTDETNNLVWIDENRGIVFRLNGFLDESVMVHIAQSLVLTNSTK